MSQFSKVRSIRRTFFPVWKLRNFTLNGACYKKRVRQGLENAFFWSWSSSKLGQPRRRRGKRSIRTLSQNHNVFLIVCNRSSNQKENLFLFSSRYMFLLQASMFPFQIPGSRQSDASQFVTSRRWQRRHQLDYPRFRSSLFQVPRFQKAHRFWG